MSLENSPDFLLNFSERKMNGEAKHFYQFKSFRLDVAERQLLNDEVIVPLGPKVFDVLVILVERAGHLVEKDDLLQLVWADSFVEEANIARIIHTLRKILGEDKNGNKFIETVAKKGYRFVAEVSEINASPSPDSSDANIQATDAPPKFSPAIKRRRALAVFALAVLFVGALGFSYYLLSLRKNISTANDKKSIAVLPFVNTDRDADVEYLSDGITENVINSLSQLSGLKVMAKNSVSRYKGREGDLKKIADELGVQNLVTGEFRQTGNNIIISVHLIDPNDGSQIWGNQFVKNSSDLITTQNEIAQALAQNLRLNLTDAEKQQLSKRPTENAEAYQLYLRGRFSAQLNTPDALNKSIEFYQLAIEKDPKFALAFSEIGMRYINLGIYFAPPRQMMPNARIYAAKALELDQTLSDPHVILGLVALLYDWDLNKAKEELAKGDAVNLQSIETFNCTAHVLQVTGRASEADESLRRALENDPLSISLTTELGCNSYYARRYDESINQYREALIIEPRNFMALYGLARSLNQQKQYQEAISEIEKAKSFMPMLPSIAVAEKGFAYAKLGKREEAERELKMLEEQSKQIYVDPFLMATVYLSLDDKDETFAWLEKAYQAKSSLIPTLVNDVKWDALRDDARFQNLLRQVGSPG